MLHQVVNFSARLEGWQSIVCIGHVADYARAVGVGRHPERVCRSFQNIRAAIALRWREASESSPHMPRRRGDSVREAGVPIGVEAEQLECIARVEVLDAVAHASLCVIERPAGFRASLVDDEDHFLRYRLRRSDPTRRLGDKRKECAARVCVDEECLVDGAG